MGKSGSRPRRKVPLQWSSDLAYGVGLFATDGCLYNNGRHLSFVSKDVELLDLFKKSFGLHTKISYKISGTSGQQCPHIQWGDVVLYRFFLSIGITPKKSLTIGKIVVPEKYFFDFLRGVIDGDGSFYSYYDPRWRSSFMFYLSIASGSPRFLRWIRAELKSKIGVRGHVTKSSKGITEQLKYAKTEASKIVKKMYYSSRVPCLTRKRVKIFAALKEAGYLTR